MDRDDNSLLLKWVLGLAASAIMLLAGLLFSYLHSHEQRLDVNELAIGKLTEKMIELVDVAKSAHLDQLERTTKFGAIDTKLALLDMRLSTILERVDALRGQSHDPR